MEPRATIYVGNCAKRLLKLADESVDSVVTDPPYGIEFMGAKWDSFRSTERVKRWSGKNSGSGGAGFGTGINGQTLPSYGGKRPTTARCSGCGKRDAFRNPHECEEGAEWKLEHVQDIGPPPSSLAFQNWAEGWAAQLYRVLKPGGHVLAFGGSRMYHRMVCALENQGFEIRDCIHWAYAKGMPKGLDVSRGIDKALGAKRPRTVVPVKRSKLHGTSPWMEDPDHRFESREAITEEAKKWQGWNTALKPCHEPIVVARKPILGSVSRNVLKHGTGAYNIDACRVGKAGGTQRQSDGKKTKTHGFDSGGKVLSIAKGRWAPNIVLTHGQECTEAKCVDGCPVLTMRAQSKRYDAEGSLFFPDLRWSPQDSCEFPCFVYIPKPESAEKDAGLAIRGYKAKRAATLTGTHQALESGREPELPGFNRVAFNDHPTVKPIALMAWLCRLVTPPGGTVVDPFLGSGTTGIAALREGFRFVGCELQSKYAVLAKTRIEADNSLLTGVVRLIERPKKKTKAKEPS